MDMQKFVKAKFMTAKELADRWGMNARTIDGWRYLKKGPKFIRLSKGKRGKVIYPIEEIMKWERKMVRG